MAAKPSVSFKSKGSDGAVFDATTIPVDADDRLPVSAPDVGLPTYRAQRSVTPVKVTLTAGAATDLMAADPTRTGARILNWTASPIYFVKGATGTPASGAPSDFCPAAGGGEPGQCSFEHRPVDAYRVVGASAGDLTLITW